jgi:hypothetical protein
MNKQLDAGTWTLNDVPTYTFEPLTAANSDYTVTFGGDLIDGYQLTSVGRHQNQTKTVLATVMLTSPISEDFAIFCRSQLSVKAKATVGGYNSADPSDTNVDANIGSQSIESNMINVKKGSDINANIYISQSGDADTIIKSIDNLNINGTILYMPVDYYLPPVLPPDNTASQGTIEGKNITLNSSDSGKYDDISISNNGTLSINGDLTLYITGDIELKNNAEIEIKNNSSLKLYFDGDIEAKNASGFNNKTEIPANLKIFGTGTNQDIDIKNSSDLYGVVYAPNAEMTVHNKVDAYGSFIVEDFELKNGGEVYYDKALRQVSIDDELIRFTVTRWEEK